MVEKALKKRGRGRPKGSKNKVIEREPKRKKNFDKAIINVIAETLQANSDGEFDFPSELIRYTDKTHPKYRLGLHREMFVSLNAPYYPSETRRAMDIYKNQANMIAFGLLNEDYPVREKNFKLPLCKDCK